jgi:CBS domain containing-hemolysin-like protein
MHPGEKVEMNEGKITLVVLQMHGRRIVKVKVIIHSKQGDSTS